MCQSCHWQFDCFRQIPMSKSMTDQLEVFGNPKVWRTKERTRISPQYDSPLYFQPLVNTWHGYCMMKICRDSKIFNWKNYISDTNQKYFAQGETAINVMSATDENENNVLWPGYLAGCGNRKFYFITEKRKVKLLNAPQTRFFPNILLYLSTDFARKCVHQDFSDCGKVWRCKFLSTTSTPVPQPSCNVIQKTTVSIVVRNTARRLGQMRHELWTREILRDLSLR